MFGVLYFVSAFFPPRNSVVVVDFFFFFFSRFRCGLQFETVHWHYSVLDSNQWCQCGVAWCFRAARRGELGD